MKWKSTKNGGIVVVACNRMTSYFCVSEHNSVTPAKTCEQAAREENNTSGWREYMAHNQEGRQNTRTGEESCFAWVPHSPCTVTLNWGSSLSRQVHELPTAGIWGVGVRVFGDGGEHRHPNCSMHAHLPDRARVWLVPWSSTLRGKSDADPASLCAGVVVAVVVVAVCCFCCRGCFCCCRRRGVSQARRRCCRGAANWLQHRQRPRVLAMGPEPRGNRHAAQGHSRPSQPATACPFLNWHVSRNAAAHAHRSGPGKNDPSPQNIQCGGFGYQYTVTDMWTDSPQIEIIQVWPYENPPIATLSAS